MTNEKAYRDLRGTSSLQLQGGEHTWMTSYDAHTLEEEPSGTSFYVRKSTVLDIKRRTCS